MSNLLVEDENIKVSKSSFSIFKSEVTVFEGRKEKMHITSLSLKLKNRSCGFDAILYEVLNVVYELNFCTSRQITEYLTLSKPTMSIDQEVITRKLETLRRNGVIDRYSFSSEVSSAETGMKVFSITDLGKILLQGRGFICNYKHTDNLFTDRMKKYLIRNQYMIKLIKDTKLTIANINLRPQQYGVEISYTIDDILHLVIPVRRYEDFKDDFGRIILGLKQSPVIHNTQLKILVLGEDVNHVLDLYRIVHECGIPKEQVYFLQDLRLFDRHISKSFIRFGVEIQDNKKRIVLQEELISELTEEKIT